MTCSVGLGTVIVLEVGVLFEVFNELLTRLDFGTMYTRENIVSEGVIGILCL